MPQDRPEKPSWSRTDHTYAELSAGTAGAVVQAGAVSGGVHFHQAGPAGGGGGQVPRQLPADVRGFVGRAQELARLDAISAEPGTGRLTVGVIAGTAGVGKTSLAVHWAHRVSRRFPDGQLYVNLRGYDSGPPVGPAEVLERFLRALGIPAASVPTGLDDRAALYRSSLAGRRVLVVLDNAATAGQVRPLLPGTGVVVVTSRNRLSGLVARDGAQRVSLSGLRPAEATDLVRAATEGYRLADDPTDLAELVRLCAGLPLALRIAAERAASRPHSHLRELVDDLRGESSLWEVLSSQDDEEADSVRAVFAWSYRSLPPQAARLFRLLGLHPGADFTAAAAAALSGQPVGRTRNLLDLLAGVHLLEQSASERYRFHDLLRAYAADEAHRQDSPEDRHNALHRVLSWYLHTAAAAVTAAQGLYPAVPVDPPPEGVTPLAFFDRPQALRWYRGEQGNLPTATRTARDVGLDRIAWQLPAVLHAINEEHQPFDDWFTTGRIALDATRRLGERDGEALILTTLAAAHNKSRRHQEAITHHRAALGIRRETDDRAGQAQSLNSIGVAYLRLRQLEEARRCFEQAAGLAADIADTAWTRVMTANLADTHAELGHFDTAVDLASRALPARGSSVGDPFGEVVPLVVLSRANRGLGRARPALTYIDQALAVVAELESPMAHGYVLYEFGHVQRANHRPAQALAAYQRCAAVQRMLGDRVQEAWALDAVGETYQELARHREAVDFHRTAVVILREQSDHWHLALALANLANALDQADDPGPAREYRQDAADILARFPDPRAAALREHLTALLTRGAS